MAEDGGIEPHPISENLVFKASRRTNAPASSSLFGREYWIRTSDTDFKDRCLRPLGEFPTKKISTTF